ncbi:MAG: DNA-deoxyinosine glycosylase [Woeseiaceae bacterium]
MTPGRDVSVDLADGFPPVALANAHILILGSLPGVRSIQAMQYYAHPRNAFWQIMADLVGAAGDYRARCSCLMQHGIAVWDVLASSVRPGSLDSDIDMTTARVNDFPGFFANHPGIERVCFNGQKAEKIFRSRVMLDDACDNYRLTTLPSTSPAHASMSYEQKLKLWRDGLGMRSVELPV